MGEKTSVDLWQPLALDILKKLKDTQSDVKMYTLIDYLENVEIRLETPSNDKMSAAVKDLINAPYFGNGTFEKTFHGLKEALKQSDEHNFICLFSDEVGSDTESPESEKLKQEIINLRDTTESKIFFLMRPYQGNFGTMESIFKDIGQVIDIESHDKEETLANIMKALRESEICTPTIRTEDEGEDEDEAKTTTTMVPTGGADDDDNDDDNKESAEDDSVEDDNKDDSEDELKTTTTMVPTEGADNDDNDNDDDNEESTEDDSVEDDNKDDGEDYYAH